MESNHEGAPNEGRVWVEEDKEDNDNRYQNLRGGSWSYYPGLCRSASRVSNAFWVRDDVIFNVGFRVACVAGRTS